MNDWPLGAPRFSLIIPAYNEEAYLPWLLDTVDEARARYVGGPETIEVVVADNASTDGTRQVARRRGC
ncbi:MAG: glycosyltransferase, partial [Deltaproteobacteria bacterium]|nr:glycosyltransferase [Deltaproteobacteria bacterium]